MDLPTRRLVLSLYKSLQKIAAKYDKNIPCGKNPLFLMQREKDAKTPELQSVYNLIREPFKTNKDLSNTQKITLKIQDAFSHLKILHQFYHPSIAWISILSRKNIPFDEVFMTICKFENPESEDGTKHLSTMNKRVQLYLTKAQAKESTPSESAGPSATQGNDADASAAQVNAEIEGEILRAQAAIRNLIGSLDEAGNEKRLQDSHAHAKAVMESISRVMYKDMGFRESVNKLYLHMSKALAGGGAVPYSVLASTIIALAQHENVQLYTVVLSPGAKSLLRYSYLQDSIVCHEKDVFMDPATGEVLLGLRAVKPLVDKTSHKITREVGGATMVLVEHKNNSMFVLHMAAALAAHKPSQWKEHLTVIEELKKQPEVEPTQVFQFSTPADKSKSTKMNKETPPRTSTSPSQSPSTDATIPPPTPTSSPSPTSSVSPSPTPAATTTSAPSTAYSLNPAKYFSSFFSFFSRRPKPTTSPSPARQSPSPAEKEHQKEGEEKKGDEKTKATKGRTSHSTSPLPPHLRKYSRIWSHPSELPNNPKTRRF